jgi:putative hydrolase of the HAD superfamily
MEVISFDVDGTIVERSFMDGFWNELIPKLYAEKHGISYGEALEFVRKSYDEVGDRDVRWYTPDYWFERFQLKIDLNDVLEDYRGGLKIYPDATEILKRLRGYKLIAVSNAVREILEFELSEISEFFWKAFSCPSDFGDIRKSPEIYIRICEFIGVSPSKVLHIGDHPFFDFEVPRKAGIRSILIDREGNNGHIKSLVELEDLIKI